MSRSLRRTAVVVALALGAAASAATVANGATAAEGGAKLDNLTVAIALPNANFAPVFVAKAAGIFQKYGLDVTIKENTGASTLNMIASGQVDLTLFTTTNQLLLAEQGQPTSAIMNGLRDSGAALVGGPSITSIGQLRALGSGCRIGTTAPGTQAYGYTYEYTHTIAKLGLQQCSIEPVSSNSIAVARLVSGQVQAVVLPLPYVITFVNATGTHLLISPATRGYRKQYGLPEFISSVYWGLTSKLESERPQIVRFVKAMNETNKLFVPKNLTMLTKYLQPFDSFRAVDFKALRTALQFIILYQGPGANYARPAMVKAHPHALTTNPGYIPKSVWNASLQQYALWGIANFDAKASVNSYPERVDMSYLAAALKK